MSTILITGTSRGIGNAAARAFLDEGWKVIGTSTSGANSITHQNYTHKKLDLSNDKEIAHLIQFLQQEPLKCLINNAAVLLGDREDTTIDFEKLNTTLQVNLIGPMKLTEALLKQLQEGGRVINISSNWGTFSDPSFGPHQSNYKLSKAALNMYSKLLAARNPAITTVSFDPGWVKTDMGGNNAPTSPDAVAQDLLWLADADITTGCFYAGKEKREW